MHSSVVIVKDRSLGSAAQTFNVEGTCIHCSVFTVC